MSFRNDGQICQSLGKLVGSLQPNHNKGDNIKYCHQRNSITIIITADITTDSDVTATTTNVGLIATAITTTGSKNDINLINSGGNQWVAFILAVSAVCHVDTKTT